MLRSKGGNFKSARLLPRDNSMVFQEPRKGARADIYISCQFI